MSGHSKWHNIQKTKGAADAKRSAAFTKIAKEIIVAVKQGGSGDPNNNSRLATVIAKAKAANMPNDNIKRTIDKALGSGNTDNYESVTYEGYGPGGVAVIVEALTDNRQRTAPEVRHYFDKYGKGMGAQGCVSWSFDRKGVIIIDNEDGDYDEDAVMMDALEAGADDFNAEDNVFEITTDPDAFNDVVKALEEKNYAFVSADISLVPQTYVKLESDEDIKNMEKLLDMLDDNENYANPSALLVKRGMDIVGGLVGCLFTLIIMIFVGPMIYIASPGPIFFSQERVGRNGRKFKMYKFRSMYMDAEERKKELAAQNKVGDGMMFKMDFDPRIIGNKVLPNGKKKTGIGQFIRKTSLDEFPQFFNILVGDMSLVGTRPPTLDEWEKYEPHHRARMSFRPGLTGLWQVSGRSNITDFEEVVKLDTQYIREWSVKNDLRIIFKTVVSIMQSDGAI